MRKRESNKAVNSMKQGVCYQLMQSIIYTRAFLSSMKHEY